MPKTQERLDPIDWATYEPYLWANEAAQQPRTAVLFGALTRLNSARPSAGKPPSAARAPGGPPGEANVMALGPPAPRFSYLPISMPSLSPDGGLRRGNGGAPSAGGGPAMPGAHQHLLPAAVHPSVGDNQKLQFVYYVEPCLAIPELWHYRSMHCGVAGGEQALGDYSFSGFKSPRGAEAGASAAEQAAQSAAASTFEVCVSWY